MHDIMHTFGEDLPWMLVGIAFLWCLVAAVIGSKVFSRKEEAPEAT